MMKATMTIVSAPGGRRAKWVIGVFWLVVAVLAVPFSGKLMGIEKNDPKSSLPTTAESTRVYNIQAHLQPPNEYFAVIVYSRASGLTAADLAKAATDAGRFAQVPGVLPGRIAGPVASRDHRAMQTVLVVNVGSKGSAGVASAATAL